MTGLQWQGGIFVFVFVVVFEFVFVFVFVLFLNLINQIQTWCRRLVRSDWGGIFVFVFVFLFVFVFVFLFVFVLNPNLMRMTCPQWLGRHQRRQKLQKESPQLGDILVDFGILGYWLRRFDHIKKLGNIIGWYWTYQRVNIGKWQQGKRSNSQSTWPFLVEPSEESK